MAQTAEDEQLDDYIKTYSSMKPKEAAAIFDTMTDNLKLVAQILDGMDADSRAAYFRQAHNGRFIRMALILSLLGLQNEVERL